MDRPTLIGPEAFHRPAAETPGVDRREAFADDHVWAGRSRTEAGVWSGWHVHPGHDTYVFQTEGRLRLEFGPGALRASRVGQATSSSSPRAWSTARGIPAPNPTKRSSFEWARAKSSSTSTAPDWPATETSSMAVSSHGAVGAGKPPLQISPARPAGPGGGRPGAALVVKGRAARVERRSWRPDRSGWS